MTDRKTPDQLRSARWFAPDDLRAFGHRSRAMQMGYAPEEWKGRPVIAILNTWSDAQPCHMHFRDRVEWVKRGVLQAGGAVTLDLSAQFIGGAQIGVPVEAHVELLRETNRMLFLRGLIVQQGEPTIASFTGTLRKSTPPASLA